MSRQGSREDLDHHSKKEKRHRSQENLGRSQILDQYNQIHPNGIPKPPSHPPPTTPKSPKHKRPLPSTPSVDTMPSNIPPQSQKNSPETQQVSPGPPPQYTQQHNVQYQVEQQSIYPQQPLTAQTYYSPAPQESIQPVPQASAPGGYGQAAVMQHQQQPYIVYVAVPPQTIPGAQQVPTQIIQNPQHIIQAPQPVLQATPPNVQTTLNPQTGQPFYIATSQSTYSQPPQAYTSPSQPTYAQPAQQQAPPPPPQSAYAQPPQRAPPPQQAQIQPAQHVPLSQPIYAQPPQPYAPPQQNSTPQQSTTVTVNQQPQQTTTQPQRVQGYAPMMRAKPRMSKQDIRLTDGEFIVKVPLSNEYLKHVVFKDNEEFTHLKYTAATTDPNDFAKTYTLRQKELGRKTKIAVVCTMYAEDDILFTKTMSAVHDNIMYLCDGNSNGKGWGPDSWKEVVVVIVSDGRSKVHPKTLDVLSVMGCYMDGLPRASVNDKPVTGHIFEFSTQVRVNSHLVTRFADTPGKNNPGKMFPMQTIFLLKEKNAKKINSHRWFFKAVCDQLDPEICILIDVGTKPTERSFYHLYRAFERNPNVAGACGEIAAELGPWMKNLLNPLVAVQNFEYKMSNILDKPLESMFGYISVLPGAFSAYKYKALQGKPLEMYFKGENPHGTNVSEANMYLAEDRILCFELVMRSDAQYVLKYVKLARAETDVPSELHDLIKQRRRWLNGSFFATIHALANTGRIFSSGHTFGRKLLLTIEAVYNFVNVLFSWFNIGNMYLAFYFLFNIASTSEIAACTGGVVSVQGADPFYPYGGSVSGVLRAIYLGSVMSMVIASLGNRPEAIKTMHITFVVIFAILMVFMVFMGIYSIQNSIKTYLDYVDPYNRVRPNVFQYMKDVPDFRNLVISILSTYVLYILSSIIHMDPWHASMGIACSSEVLMVWYLGDLGYTLHCQEMR
ncbi:Chitin synthase, class 1 [Rhizoclosmatium sp. JEL0117]|nr:Chitin synthase, class 1 [Rhizoclosmatium sp. JEL0117]